MQTVRVTIKPIHFKRAPTFFNCDCPLAIALKDMGYKNVIMGTEQVYLDDKRYKIPKDKWGGFQSPYPPGYVDRLIQLAKENISSIPTVELQLTRF